MIALLALAGLAGNLAVNILAAHIYDLLSKIDNATWRQKCDYL